MVALAIAGSVRRAEHPASPFLCNAQNACGKTRKALHPAYAAPQQNPASSPRGSWANKKGMASAPAGMEMMMEQATKATEILSKATRDAAEFGRGNLEAVAQSAQAYAQGTQELGRQALALAQDL